jgi:benzodiazapine receptor/tryptophan-rich sensory protein
MQKGVAALTSIGSVLASAAIGASFGPTPAHPRTAIWYFFLRKPGFTPPGPLIGATWGLLDILLAVSGYRLLMAPPSRGRDVALGGWLLSVIGVAAHPVLFFGRRSKAGGFSAAASMIASSATASIAASRVDRFASLCGVPLVLWSLFAGLLSEEIVRKN